MFLKLLFLLSVASFVPSCVLAKSQSERLLLEQGIVGNVKAQLALGELYELTYEDYFLAAKWYEKAANAGSVRAEYLLAGLYDGHHEGRGLDRNWSIAVKWYKQSASHGYLKAQYKLGQLYKEHASKWYQKENLVGGKYHFADGVEQCLKISKNYFLQAASAGDAKAQNKMGDIYYHGIGTLPNYTKASFWYQKAVKQGVVEAQRNLATLYQSGKGVTQNYSNAAKLYQQAALHGDAEAENNLAILYETGSGVRKSKTIAIQWYEKACSNSYKSACTAVQVLEGDK